MFKLVFRKSSNFLLFFLLGINAIQAAENKRFENPNMLNYYGMPGTIDNPTAEAFPEGQFAVSSSVFGGTIRTNLSFQISHTLTTSFRYSRIPSLDGDHKGYFWDRSFDVHYLVTKQSLFFPSIAVGLRDFIGTGLYSGEYLVATKNIGSRVKLTAGIGWGRLSGENNYENIFGRVIVLQDLRGLVVLFILINFFQVRILHFLDFIST